MDSLSISTCPWCDGKGKRTISCGPLINEVGVSVNFESVTCGRCEGGGVIAFKAVKSFKDFEESADKDIYGMD